MIIIYDYDKDNSINDNEIFINDFLIIFEIKSAIVLKGIWWQTHLQYKVSESQSKILQWWGYKSLWLLNSKSRL